MVSVSIYYDGQCPFCSNYVSLLRLREAVGPVRLVNLRSDEQARRRLENKGLNLDNGMAVEVGDALYHGADAMDALYRMGGGWGAASKLYPLLRAGRNLTLFILGREPIAKRDVAEVALFAIFNRFFGLYILLNAAYHFMAPQELRPLAPILFVLGGLLFFIPSSRRIFALAAIVQAADAFWQAPSNSNHVILQNFLLLGAGLAGLSNLARGSTWEAWFRSIRPMGRCLLLTMYVFGIFHKINTSFLDPAVSCAVALWREMPPPLYWIDNAPMHYFAIYGTFAAEGVILVMLIVQRWRHIGIIAGILFHALLALSGYATYAAFSTLAAALHVLFLTPALALRISQTGAAEKAEAFIRSRVGIALYCSVFLYLGMAAFSYQPLHVTGAWMLAIATPIVIIVWQGWRRDCSEHERNFFWSRPVSINAVSLLFFLNCAAPYFGLKTAQAMNMFSNLRLEGQWSNHLLVSDVGPFQYLDDVVAVRKAESVPRLRWYAEHPEKGLTYYAFLAELDNAPYGRVSYFRNGVEHREVPASDILKADGGLLHSQTARKYFHFRPVDLAEPVQCEQGRPG